jgi:hypothetical protein
MTVLLLAMFAGDPMFAGVVKDAAGKLVAGAVVAPAVNSRDEETTSVVTDASGAFSFKAPSSMQREFARGGLVAIHPEHGLGLRDLREGESTGLEVRLVKGRGVRIVVMGSDGKPLQGALVGVGVLRLDHEPFLTPKAIGDRAAVRTGVDGTAMLAMLDSKRISQLRVDPSSGPSQFFQPISWEGGINTKYEWESVRLLPTTTVKGRFTGQPWPKGKEIIVDSFHRSKESVVVTVESTVKPTDDGVFTAPAIADSVWRVRAKFDGMYVVNLRDAPKATKDAPEKVWTLAAMRPVTGVVRTREGKPVAGARVSVNSQSGGGGIYTTGADGRFKGWVPPGRIFQNVSPPTGYIAERFRMDQIEVAAGTEPFELPPLVVGVASSIQGVVKDEYARPAGGARVVALCSVSRGGGMTSHTARHGSAALDGAFRIDNIPEGASVTLRAFHEERGSFAGPIEAVPNAKGIELKLNFGSGVRLAVAAADEAGKPIERAEFRVEFTAEWFKWLRQDLQRPIQAAGEIPLHLGVVPKGISYQIAASAPGYLPVASSLTADGKLAGPVTLILRRALELTGRVVDAAGKPVAGALVKPAGAYGAEGTATTDSDGRFSLVGLTTTTAVITAQGEGFRHGGAIATVGKQATITLKRTSEPAPRSAAAEFPPSHKALAKRLLDPLAEEVFGNKGEMKTWWAQSYAFMDPAKLLELIDGPNWTNDDRDFARHHLATALAATDVDEAIAQANAIGEADRKAGTLLKVAEQLPESAKARHRPILADALTTARAGNDPARKALFIAKVGEALHEAGDPEGAKAIREAEGLARKLAKDGWSAYAAGSVAESVALVDFGAAMDLTKDLPGSKGEERSSGGGSDSYAFNRHRGNIAHKIARLQPANAEKAYESMTMTGRSSRVAAGMSYRMAPIDLPRAKRIVQAIPISPEKAVCLCAMAVALGPQRKDKALPLIKEAFTALNNNRNPAYNGYGNAPLAMALVYAAVVVAPDEADDFFWQALATPGPTRPTARGSFGRDGRVGAVAVTALLAERYDREIAAALAGALKDEAPTVFDKLTNHETRDDAMAALTALLALCPETAETIPWPAATSGGPNDQGNYARLTVGGLLLASPSKRNDKLTERFLHQWYIDKEDL